MPWKQSKLVRLSSDVLEALETHRLTAEDSPNRILRRLLGLRESWVEPKISVDRE
jgi:hypothetical protein